MTTREYALLLVQQYKVDCIHTILGNTIPAPVYRKHNIEKLFVDYEIKILDIIIEHYGLPPFDRVNLEAPVNEIWDEVYTTYYDLQLEDIASNAERALFIFIDFLDAAKQMITAYNAKDAAYALPFEQFKAKWLEDDW